MTDSIFKTRVQQPLETFVRMSPEQRTTTIRAAVSDLNAFLDDGRPLGGRVAPERTIALAKSLHEALENLADDSPVARSGARVATLAERIVTDALLRGECDRDQNVYMGPLFTRRLTSAVPDLIFQPVSLAEASATLTWARVNRVPLVMRGAASTAMGGAVPNDAGLTLDLSRLDDVLIEPEHGVAVVGAGARLRTLHQKLAERGLALPAYPSNLGGTLAGWFMTGGIGLNAFRSGRALDLVRSADVVLLSGEHIRFHDDGRLDVPGEHRRTLDREESTAWFHARGLDPVTLAELAGSEGVFGLLTHLTVRVEPRPEIGAFLLAFDSRLGAFQAARWVAEEAGRRFGAPANLKAMSGEHLHHVRRVWADEDARAAHRGSSQLTDGTRMPWRRLVGPEGLGAAPAGEARHDGVTASGPSADSANGHSPADPAEPAATAGPAPAPARPHGAEAGSVLFVDFFDLDAARAFAASLGEMPGAPQLLVEESARFARERFRPQQTKRLGPGLVAAEIVMPADQVTRFLPKAARLVRNAGSALDAEVYYLADGQALVIGAYLTDQRRGDFWLDLMIAPALVDLAMRGHRGRPYVLGRWQSAWARHKFGAAGIARLLRIKQVVDDSELVNRGVLLGLRLHGTLGRFMTASFVPGVSMLSRVYGFTPLRPLVALARALFATRPGPGHGRGAPLPADPHRAGVAGPAGQPASPVATTAPATLEASARAIHCVNCGECNSVCPIFHESRIRLPQMLTHVAEAAHGGLEPDETGSVLLDLCMRCGNCEEVCQAGIPHLELYEGLQRRADAARPPDRERHTAIVAAVRGSPHYTRDFLQIRPGGYVKRAPASLPGAARYVLIRSENESGAASTCIHCGACVPVCPTNANHEFEAQDPRWITTVQERCIGCGTCVEVCPANLANGGRTLRVMEAPTLAWTEAVAEFERTESRASPQPIP